MKRWGKQIAAGLMVLLLGTLSITAFAALGGHEFTDVEEDSWYAQAVNYCSENQLVSGLEGSRFCPDRTMSRAMLAAVLYRVQGSPVINGGQSFADAADGVWYEAAVNWAVQNGIMSGYGDGLFHGDDPVTREQIVSVLWRYAGSPAAERAGEPFSDEETIASWAVTAVNWAQETGMMSGKPGNVFDPKGNASRAEAAVILFRYLNENADLAKQDGQRVLIAYFSRWGNTDYPEDVDAVASASILMKDEKRIGTTELIAQGIQTITGGDLYQIQTVDSYPVEFDEVVVQNHQEQAAGTLPALKDSAVDLDQYDVIFVGYPVWASTAPAPVLSFLSQYDFSGKTVIPFCTHDGYGGSGSFDAVAAAVSKSATVLGGFEMSSEEVSSAQDKLNQWIQSLPLGSANQKNKGTDTPAAASNVTITVGDTVLNGTLNGSEAAKEFADSLPQSISMVRYGDREYYGTFTGEISTREGGRLSFENGDITYCPENNTAAIFFAQTDHPDLTMQVIPVGRVTSDLAVFHELGSRITVRFELGD